MRSSTAIFLLLLLFSCTSSHCWALIPPRSRSYTTTRRVAPTATTTSVVTPLRNSKNKKNTLLFGEVDRRKHGGLESLVDDDSALRRSTQPLTPTRGSTTTRTTTGNSPRRLADLSQTTSTLSSTESSVVVVIMMLMGWMSSMSMASAGLLDEFGTDPNKIVNPTKNEVVVAPKTKGDKAIDPTLRASYYYPTAKKRYLPRIQKVTQELGSLPLQQSENNNNDNSWWTSIQHFSNTADDAILPLQLYVSSLDGQGLSMKNQYAIQMKRDAYEFEQSYRDLQIAIRQHNRESALTAITNMGVAVADYRQQGRLSDDDGNIPSIDDVKRMTMRNPTIKINIPSK